MNLRILFFSYMFILNWEQVYTQVICENFDAIVVPQTDVQHTFNIYGNGNNGFLNDWEVTNGTPSIYSANTGTYGPAYSGIQYAFLGVDNSTIGEGVTLKYNFQAGRSHSISFARRNAIPNTFLNVDYVLLDSNIPFTYQFSAGATPVPNVPSGSLLIYTDSSLVSRPWEVLSITTPILTQNYSRFWIRPSWTLSPSQGQAFFLFDSACVQPVGCNLALNIGPDRMICSGTSITLDAQVNGATYLWNDGTTAPTLSVTSPGLYWVNVNSGNCSVSDSILISPGGPPSLDLGEDREICVRGGITLTAPPNAQYRWQDSSTESYYHVTQSGLYSVTVDNGCGIASDDVRLTVYADECALLIPTAFSPNNDGVNDQFRATSRCEVNQFSIKVFNRWGEQVYASENIERGWDGIFREEPQPLGVFVYQCEYFNQCENKLKKLSGNFTLLR